MIIDRGRDTMDVDVRKIENNSEATARRRVFNYNWTIYKLARNYDYSLSIVSTGRMILEIQGSSSDFLMKLSTCLLVVRIYPIHIKMIGVVQWYVLCPILSFFCIIIIHTYVFKHGCALGG